MCYVCSLPCMLTLTCPQQIFELLTARNLFQPKRVEGCSPLQYHLARIFGMLADDSEMQRLTSFLRTGHFNDHYFDENGSTSYCAEYHMPANILPVQTLSSLRKLVTASRSLKSSRYTMCILPSCLSYLQRCFASTLWTVRPLESF